MRASLVHFETCAFYESLSIYCSPASLNLLLRPIHSSHLPLLSARLMLPPPSRLRAPSDFACLVGSGLLGYQDSVAHGEGDRGMPGPLTACIYSQILTDFIYLPSCPCSSRLSASTQCCLPGAA
ncbi:hypothetical protein OH76DRAFT_1009608 [Lentinus brumalis]|uniref:Uncharacterized protein n=1 Tax=Lentinus brumalis TaxID=2498619 RepID=A0A371CY91_9APHY|nr:hypothetical protein OH76DRAFT_1009608 [Polyporus brumalis]